LINPSTWNWYKE